MGRLAEFASWEAFLKKVVSDEYRVSYGVCEQSSLRRGAPG
jgi:hypothetical protein